MTEDFDTPRELAERLQVTEQVITKWLRRGLIQGFRVGWNWRIPRSEVNRVLREGVGVANPRPKKEEK